jgi:hypothetical protein
MSEIDTGTADLLARVDDGVAVRNATACRHEAMSVSKVRTATIAQTSVTTSAAAK